MISIEQYYETYFKKDLKEDFSDLLIRFQMMIKVSYNREINKLNKAAEKDAIIFQKLYKKIK